MSELVVAENMSEAWLRTLEIARAAPGGRRAHLITAVTRPGTEVLDVRELLDKALADHGKQSIDTVAETIFPSSLYPNPGIDWNESSSKLDEEALDAAADTLYATYIDILPMLRTVNANKRGTYFSRMITWPGKEPGGLNQVAARIKRLRDEARQNKHTLNTLDIDVADDASAPLPGLQVYAADDKRTRGFPCLTHVDFTLLNGVLHCTAVYRHQYLIEKSYGNMVGLSALMQFLCQQGGCELGELVVHATLADAQPRVIGDDVNALVADANTALKAATDG